VLAGAGRHRYGIPVAGGRAVGRFEAALGVIGVVALVTTYSLVTGWNPVSGLRLSDVWAWFSTPGPLSRPETAWTTRVGGQPTGVALANHSVLVFMRGVVESHDVGTGTVRWSREADWGAVAGSAGAAVAVVGKAHGHGYDVLDPDSGTVRWSDGAALGVWTYQDVVLSLSCPGLSDCTLSARAPTDGTLRWKTPMPGIGRVLAGVNKPLLGTRELASSYVDALANSPGPVPRMLGFPLDRRVQVLDTATGKFLLAEGTSETVRVVVAGGRAVVSTAVPRDGTCRFTVEAREPASGRTVWRREGYDLRTASGVGCEQRRDPGGGDGVLATTRSDRREVLLSASDGRELWVGAAGEAILATDGRYGLVRSADHTSVKAVDLNRGGTLWTRQAAPKSAVAVTRYAVLIADLAVGRLVALDPTSGRVLLDVHSDADVLGYGSTGLILGRGRTIGFLPFGSPAAG
jgi:outer membrane protein assembly factor BamB